MPNVKDVSEKKYGEKGITFPILQSAKCEWVFAGPNVWISETYASNVV